MKFTTFWGKFFVLQTQNRFMCNSCKHFTWTSCNFHVICGIHVQFTCIFIREFHTCRLYLCSCLTTWFIICWNIWFRWLIILFCLPWMFVCMYECEIISGIIFSVCSFLWILEFSFLLKKLLLQFVFPFKVLNSYRRVTCIYSIWSCIIFMIF